ncbi:NUDIX domain-containing protein [Azorhizobium doebereinerae]|uniref:NUDIX domain-containing protein n=1 Tax=Azorhizobium doebereinerae TaxID=281091 RepID=UPI0003F84EAA|nr:NUDIX hydrolase [Azorhizobium doebereinerae]
MTTPPLQDETARIDILDETLIYQGFRRFESYRIRLHTPNAEPVVQNREILRVGGAVGIVVIDPERQALVLLRQFRMTAHLATGFGEQIEIPAGLVEPGEDPAVTARRECVEETGLDPGEVHHMFSCLVSPGAVDEMAHFYLAFADASHMPQHTGAEGETEVIRPFLVPLDQALAAMEDGSRLANGYLRIGLMWVALHRARVDAWADAWRAARSDVSAE